MKTNDSGLIQDVVNGNLSSFNILMQKYEKLVFTIAMGFAKDRNYALDITQNVFIKVYQKLNTFKNQSSFKSWLSKVSYNEGINWVRKNRIHKMHDTLSEKHAQSYFMISDEDEYMAKENKSELIRSLYSLNTGHRLAVVLRYFENMPVKNIAEIIGCSEGVIKNMLYRSLRKLKENLQQKEKNME